MHSSRDNTGVSTETSRGSQAVPVIVGLQITYIFMSFFKFCGYCVSSVLIAWLKPAQWTPQRLREFCLRGLRAWLLLKDSSIKMPLNRCLCFSVCSSQILTETNQGHEILVEDPAQVSILLISVHLKSGWQLHPALWWDQKKHKLIQTQPKHHKPKPGFPFPKGAISL